MEASTLQNKVSKFTKLGGIVAMVAASALAGCGDEMEPSRLFVGTAFDGDAGSDTDVDADTNTDTDLNEADVLNIDTAALEDTKGGGKFETSVDAGLIDNSAPEIASDAVAELTADAAKDCGTLTNCNDQCVNLVKDPNHCGACDNVCPGNKPYCTPTGGCQECPGTLQKCPGTADCLDLNANDQHCGGCGPGLACSGGEHCTNGICQ